MTCRTWISAGLWSWRS